MCVLCRIFNLILLFSFIFVAISGTSIKFNYTESIIEKVNSANAKWKAGQNFDPDTPLSYLKNLMGVKQYTETLLLREHDITSDIEIPEEFDSREHWPKCPTIKQIRDQGKCGSCWAVTTAAVVSDRYCIATKGTFTLPLSEQELLSCCSFCGKGCRGGYPIPAWKYIARFGIVTGGGYNSSIGCQPYKVINCDHHVNGGLPRCSSLPYMEIPKCEERCTNPSYNTPFNSDHYKVHRAYTIKKDVTHIQREIFMHGPVQTIITVYSDLTAYKSGVYHHITGFRMGMHAVKILGWGVEDGTPYWLVANSWNTHWGDKGFFKILRGKNHCEIESAVMAALPVQL